MRSQEALWACAEGAVETTANVDMNRAAASTNQSAFVASAIASMISSSET